MAIVSITLFPISIAFFFVLPLCVLCGEPVESGSSSQSVPFFVCPLSLVCVCNALCNDRVSKNAVDVQCNLNALKCVFFSFSLFWWHFKSKRNYYERSHGMAWNFLSFLFIFTKIGKVFLHIFCSVHGVIALF